jgi:hypothetical protein
VVEPVGKTIAVLEANGLVRESKSSVRGMNGGKRVQMNGRFLRISHLDWSSVGDDRFAVEDQCSFRSVWIIEPNEDATVAAGRA